MTAIEPIRCVDCNVIAEISVRTEFEWRRRGGGWRCRVCRRPPPRATAAMRRWWLSRFPQDELVQLAAVIWPNDHRGTSENVRSVISHSTSSRRT